MHAEHAGAAMWAADTASQGLGMALEDMGPGQARMTMTVEPRMLNGHGTCHGGFIFALADSAFAFACNSRGQQAVAQTCTITYLRPGPVPAERLVATARELALAGRSGLYDVQVAGQGGVVAEFRGQSREVGPRAVLPVTRLITELDPIERASRDELVALQTARLADTLRRVYAAVPHYQRAFEAAGVHPDDFRERWRTCGNFRSPPRRICADNYPFGLFAVPREQVARIHASSGTTGKPVVVGYTASDLDDVGGGGGAVVVRGGRAARHDDAQRLWLRPVHRRPGRPCRGGAAGADRGCRCAGGMTERQVQLIADFRPDIITVTPSYMLALLDEFARQGIDPRRSSLKIGVFGAEPWTNAMRGEIERAFGMDAVDIYGLSEVIGPGVAQECVEGQGRAAHLGGPFLPRGDRPGERRRAAGRRAGRTGVHLADQAGHADHPLPHPRPDTRLLPGTARPSFRRMEKVTGRSDDMIILRGVNVFPTQIEELLLATENGVPGTSRSS